jgi:hypothetical protein
MVSALPAAASRPPMVIQPLSSTSRVMMIGLSSKDVSLSVPVPACDVQWHRRADTLTRLPLTDPAGLRALDLPDATRTGRGRPLTEFSPDTITKTLEA